MNWKKLGLTGQILVAMALAILIGSVLKASGSLWAKEALTDGLFRIVGQIFIISLRMLVVPLVFISLVSGASALGDPKKLGIVGGKTLLLYLFTTAVAIITALLVAGLINPGIGFELPTETVFEAKPAPSISDILIGIFPDNPIRAMADGNMLQVIVFALLSGVALSLVGKRANSVKKLFDELNEVVMRMVGILMTIAPFGVFALLARVFADQGLGVALPLAKYFFAVLLVLIFHATFTYGMIVSLLARLNPFVFFRKFRAVMLFAFSTASSNATLPVTLRVVEKRLGAHNSIAAFTVPLGATINMDGTAIMQGVATVFIAQAYMIDLSLGDFLQVILTATLASVGTAGVPGVGLVTLAMVLQQVGLPVEGIALIIGVDRLLDMTRTAVNVAGDAVVTCVVARSEGALDLKVYNDLSLNSADDLSA